MPVAKQIEIQPIITSTTDTPEQIQQALEASGLEAVPVVDVIETEPVTDPPAEIAPPSELPSVEIAPASETDEDHTQEFEDEEDDEEQADQQAPPADQAPKPGDPPKPKRRRGGKDAKIHRLTKEKNTTLSEKLRLEGELAEVKRQLEASRQQPQPKVEPQPEPVAQPAAKEELKKPVRPKLADPDINYDQALFEQRMDEYYDAREQYLDALLDRQKEEVAEAARSTVAQQTQLTEAEQQRKQAISDSLAAVQKRIPDVKQVVDAAKDVPFSDIMSNIVVGTEDAWVVGYYLAQNPAIAKAIFDDLQFPPDIRPIAEAIVAGKPVSDKDRDRAGQAFRKLEQKAAKYVGQITAQFPDEDETPVPVAAPTAEAAPSSPAPVVRKPETSRAPAPPKPIKGGNAPAATADPTKMKHAEWRIWRETPEGQAWRANHNV